MSFNPVEQQILGTLVSLDDAVKTLATANPKPDFCALFARLDDLAAQLPPGTPRDLQHYLQRKSYEKARLFLEGRFAEIKSGSCGR